MPRKVSVVIIGAGVGGLTLALALRHRGIEAELLEQSVELREVDAAVALAANATRLLRAIGSETAWLRYPRSRPGWCTATVETGA